MSGPVTAGQPGVNGKGRPSRPAAAAVEEKLVFEHAVAAMFQRALGDRITPELRDRLRLAGIDLERPLLPAYRLDTWMTCLALAAEVVFPGMPAEDGLRKLGERMVEAYAETAIGRALFALSRVLGPRRTLDRASQSFRSANNYSETRISEAGPGTYDLWMNEVGPHPTFTAGLIAAGMRHSGARELRVDVQSFDGHACTYRVQWKL